MTFWNRTGVLMCALALSVVAAPKAQADEGPFYVSVSGMWVLPEDPDFSQTFTNATTAGSDLTATGKLEFEDSFGFAVAFGYGELTGLRGEIEIGYRQSDFDISAGGTVDDVRVTTENVKGEVDTWSVMANGIYAFDAAGFHPYVGAGIGFAKYDGTIRAQTFTVAIDGTDNDFETPALSDDDTVFAWQLMAGVGYAVSDSTEIRLGYRYFDGADADFSGVDTDLDLGAHAVELGVVLCF